MDHPSNSTEEAAKSVNLVYKGLPSKSVRSESHAPDGLKEVLLKISQDMARVLERLTSPKAPIDMIRRHGAEELNRSNIEESDKAEFWLEKLQRLIEEVRCPRSKSDLCNFFIARQCL